ncbi:hypothetical protein L1987_43075 [Smallanthus sonchifolius]|uniref:Uncharacterized protein n=1 Tax=Smallanthus sonchifolius TaxID=185202 RepID=A0ACB9GK37_9ASTR|nr:hypothetical protein L1987_43075 [Smallanthus sonchifolius]
MFNISSLPTSLGYWLVSNYDPSCNQLNLGTHVITITSQTIHEVFGIPMGKVQFGKLKNPTMKDVVSAEFRNQFDIVDKPPTPKNLFEHLKERYKRTYPGKKQIPAISFFENNTINKLSVDDEEKEKEKEGETEIVKGDKKRKRDDKEEKKNKKRKKKKDVETETVKGDRKRKRVNLGDDDIGKKMLSTSTSIVKNQTLKVKLRAQVLQETQTQGQDKPKEFSQTDDYWQRRSYYESTAGIEGLSANASKPAHPATESEWIHMIKSKTKALDTYMSETHELIVEGYEKYKSEKIFDAIDEWRFRLKHYGDKYNKELNEDKAAQAEKGENEEKRTQSQKMMVSLFDTTQFHFSDSMLEDVITEVKKVEGQNNNEGAKIVDDVIKNVCKDISKKHTNEVVINETAQGEGGEDGEKKEEKGNDKKPAQEIKIENAQRVIQKVADPGAKAGKTSSSKPSVPASTDSVLPGLQTAGKYEKPAKGKGREGNEEKPAQVKKVKAVDAREGKKVNEDDNGKTTQDGELKKEKHHKVNVKKVKEVDAGEGKVDEHKVVAESDAGVNLNKKNKEQKKNVARATRRAEALCSPYVQRVVQLNTKRENIEDRIAEWIFASIKDPWIFVFQNATGTSIPRICMESFHPNEYLHVNTITCWSLVLNNEEIYRSRAHVTKTLLFYMLVI